MAAEGPRRRELTELVADHLLGDEDRDVLAAVVDRDRVPDHLGEDRRGARPGPDHALRSGVVHLLDAAHQPLLDVRALAGRSRHLALLLASPAPCGWSTGFMAEPRTVGRFPRHRLRPALPPVMFSWSTLPTCPTVARQASGTRRSSPEGSRRIPWPSSFPTSWIPVPAPRAILPPWPGFSSTLCTSVPVGMFWSGSALPGLMSAAGPDSTVEPTRRRAGARM